MIINKVEICGVNTSKLPILKEKEKKQLLLQMKAGDKNAREKFIKGNLRLVLSVIQRFNNRGENIDDLFQVGCIGLMKSIDNFDLSQNVKFSTYAVPMIIGEIQRFIRDDGTVKVSRSLKETGNKIRRARDELSKEKGRVPTVHEIANYLDITPEDVTLAQEASRSPTSIHETVYENDGDPITLIDQIVDHTTDGKWFDKIALREAIEHLDEREQLIVYLRYYKDQTQSEVAERLGISQVQVSRLEKKILLDIRNQMRE